MGADTIRKIMIWRRKAKVMKNTRKEIENYGKEEDQEILMMEGDYSAAI